MAEGAQGADSAAADAGNVGLRKIGAWRRIRVLAWDGDVLYGCRGYEVVALRTAGPGGATMVAWEPVAKFWPSWWRNLTSRFALSYRLVRDGFHALAVLDDKTMVGAVAGAIVTRAASGREFHVTHKVVRGTRPLHITAVPGGNIYWGEYFDNRERDEVYIYGSTDWGRTWSVAYTFGAGAIRHVHNIVYDRFAGCVWILTGDEGAECKVLRASPDLRTVETVLSGNQRARAVAAIPTEDALYLSTDTPLEQNYVLRLDRRDGRVDTVTELASSSIFGCDVAGALFFTTMVEPSEVNRTREVQLAGSGDGRHWQVLTRWQKDALPMRYFQYGNAMLPDGQNTTSYLAATTIAVERDDVVTTLWEVETPVR